MVGILLSPVQLLQKIEAIHNLQCSASPSILNQGDKWHVDYLYGQYVILIQLQVGHVALGIRAIITLPC